MAVGYCTPAMLIALLAVPSLGRVLRTYRKPRPAEAPPELPDGVWPLWIVAAAFWYTRRFGVFFIVGLVLDVVLTRA